MVSMELQRPLAASIRVGLAPPVEPPAEEEGSAT